MRDKKIDCFKAAYAGEMVMTMLFWKLFKFKENRVLILIVVISVTVLALIVWYFVFL